MNYKRIWKGFLPLGLGIAFAVWALRLWFQPQVTTIIPSIFGPIQVEVVGFAWWDCIAVTLAAIVLLYYGLKPWLEEERLNTEST
jgi:hypothetical protein